MYDELEFDLFSTPAVVPDAPAKPQHVEPLGLNRWPGEGRPSVGDVVTLEGGELTVLHVYTGSARAMYTRPDGSWRTDVYSLQSAPGLATATGAWKTIAPAGEPSPMPSESRCAVAIAELEA